MSATDRDKGVNGSVFYSIESGNDLGHFYIGREFFTSLDVEFVPETKEYNMNINFETCRHCRNFGKGGGVS